MKKEKHGKSDKHSKMSRPDGKTVSVKKELVTPVKVCVYVWEGGGLSGYVIVCMHKCSFRFVCLSLVL